MDALKNMAARSKLYGYSWWDTPSDSGRARRLARRRGRRRLRQADRREEGLTRQREGHNPSTCRPTA